MSQTRTLSVLADTVVRTHIDGTGGEGCGNSKHIYVGRSGTGSGVRQYTTYIKFNLDWTNVGKIVSATLNLYTDEYDSFGPAGEPGIMAAPAAGDKPKVNLYRNTSAFTVGNNSDGHFDSGDYTTPAHTTSGGGQKVLTPIGADLLHSVDVTGIVMAWAPATVQGGGKQPNHGMALTGTTATSENWSGWSNDHQGGGGAAERPSITLVYELGPTAPNAPSNMTPAGTVASFTDFEGDFSDVRPTDTLQSTDIEIYEDPHASSASASTDLITFTAHGLLAGDIIYFTVSGTGTGLTAFKPYYVIASGLTKDAFKVSATPGGAALNILASDSVSWARQMAAVSRVASASDRANGHFIVPKPTADRTPTTGTRTLAVHRVIPWPLAGRTYRWRARVHDQEGQVSAWSGLVAFVLSNTPPADPVLSPVTGQSFASFNLVKFQGGTFSDADGDKLLAHQVQLSPFPQGDIRWDEGDGILWDSGKVFAALGSTRWIDFYGGKALTAGTYYWRARQWDTRDGVSNWVYAQIILTQDFSPDPGSYDHVQIDPNAPWRIIIRELSFAAAGGNLTGNAATDTLTTTTVHGLYVNAQVRFSGLVGGAGLVNDKTYFVLSASPPTATTFKIAATPGGAPINFTTDITAGTMKCSKDRAPGVTVAVLEEAKNLGASIVYNSPGELHFTLLKDDPQISVIEPKQVHYALEFYSGDGWQEKFSGVVWEMDATELDVVFKGIDYLALYDTITDERYDPNKPNKAYSAGGSFYSNVSITTVITDQLLRAKSLQDSWVRFISLGSIATMDEKVTVYSTMQPTLSFVAGLIDSHRQGTGKRTRMKVVKTTAGGYQLQIVDDPGVIRNDLALYYGELVQGYRVIVFGDGWANVQHVVGRNREGAKVVYQTISGKPFQPATSVYGRIATVAVMDGVQDQNDLARRGLQAAIQSAKLGKNVALGLRTQFLAPLQGWDICDVFPVKVDDGAINTDNFGSGFWAAYALAWEATDIGQQSLVITLLPREDSTAPDTNLIPTRPISTQDEWQLAFSPPLNRPGISTPPRDYHYDQSTGTVYRRVLGPILVGTITGTQ